MGLNNAGATGDQSFGGFVRRVLVVAVIAALALLVWRIIDALLLAFFGVLLAVMFRGLAALVSRYTRIPMRWALLLVTVVLIGIVALFFWFAGPRINEQFAQFMEAVPTSVKRIERLLGRYSWGRSMLYSMRSAQLSMGQGIGLFSRITGIASTAFAAAANILVVVFAAVFFVIDPNLYIRGVVLLVPRNRTSRISETIDETGRIMRYWLLGQAVAMFSVGVLTALGLWLVGVPLAFLLGVIAGVLEFIPFLGPVLASIPGILIALTESWRVALYAALVYVIVQQIENRLIVPLVQWKAVALPPALVVLAVAALGLLFGPLGVLVATPLTAVLMVWVRKLYVEDVLGKHAEVRG